MITRSLFTPPCFNISTAFSAIVNKIPSFCIIDFPFIISVDNSFIRTPSSWSRDFFVVSYDGTFLSFFSQQFWSQGMERRCGGGDGWFWKKSFVISFLGGGIRTNSPVLEFWERIIAAWLYLIRWRVGTRWLRVCIVIDVSWSRGVCWIIGGIPWFCFRDGTEGRLVVEGGGVCWEWVGKDGQD